MSFPEKRPDLPDAPRPEPDFYDEALAQIHRDAIPDTSPSASPVKQAAQQLRASVCSWSESRRAEKTEKAPDLFAASPSVPAKPASKEKEPHKDNDALSRRAEKSRRNRAAAGQQKASAAQAEAPQTTAPESAASAPAKLSRRRAARKVPKKHRLNPGVRVVLCIFLVLLIGVFGWLGFGYRSCNRIARRYGEAMYRADANTMYGQYDETMLTDLAAQKRFNNVEEFLQSESTRLKEKRDRYNTSFGPNWKAEISTDDLSDLHEKYCEQFLTLYQKDYGTRIAEVRCIQITASISGSRGSDTRTDTLMMVRIGLWWYVADDIFL